MFYIIVFLVYFKIWTFKDDINIGNIWIFLSKNEIFKKHKNHNVITIKKISPPDDINPQLIIQ